MDKPPTGLTIERLMLNVNQLIYIMINDYHFYQKFKILLKLEKSSKVNFCVVQQMQIDQ